MVNNVMYWTGYGGKVGAVDISAVATGQFAPCPEIWTRVVRDIIPVEYDNPAAAPSSRTAFAYYLRAGNRGTLFNVGPSNMFALENVFNPEGRTSYLEEGVWAYALDAETGATLWAIELNHPGTDASAFGTSSLSSPSIHNGIAYFGLSSLSNLFAGSLPMTTRGFFFAIDLSLGQIKWVQRTIPEEPAGWNRTESGAWFSGGGSWVSNPTVLEGAGKDGEGLVFTGSGQLFNHPYFVRDCMEEPLVVSDGIVETTRRGETGAGMRYCYEQANIELTNMGYDLSETPLAPNSIIALNVKDGSFAWHYNTVGIDTWAPACNPTDQNAPCYVGNLPEAEGGQGTAYNGVSGPDWDVGGQAGILTSIGGVPMLIQNHKGGALFILEAHTGEVYRSMDVCVGAIIGGIHFSTAFDEDSNTIFAGCSGGAPAIFGNPPNAQVGILADGTELCEAGYLNAIDLFTGALKYQLVPHYGAHYATAAENPCRSAWPNGINPQIVSDTRFKYGVNFDVVLKNQQFAGVPVRVMSENTNVPLQELSLGRVHGPASVANGVVYWPVMNGVVYANAISSGIEINQFTCDQGGVYGGASISGGRIAFSCGYNFIDARGVGINTVVYGGAEDHQCERTNIDCE